MVTDHVIRKFTAQQQRIIAACDVPRSLPELLEQAGVKHRGYSAARTCSRSCAPAP